MNISKSVLEPIPITPAQLQDAINVLDLIDPSHPHHHPTTTTPTGTIPTSIQSIHPSNSIHALVKPSTTARHFSTPALEALRSRANQSRRSKSSIIKLAKTSTTQHIKPISIPTSSSSSSRQRSMAVQPNSQSAFLDRLKSFKLSTYPAGKPTALSPPTMTAFGWSNVSEKNRLSCPTCGATWVLATPSKDDWNSVAGKKLTELGKRMRIEQHRSSCPWRSRRCPSSVYHIPRWKSIRETVEALLEIAGRIASSFFSDGQPTFQLEHTLSDQAVKTLSIVLQSQTNSSSSFNDSRRRRRLTTEALILALFGWTVKPLQDRPLSSTRSGLTSQAAGMTPATSDTLDRSSSPARNSGSLDSMDGLPLSLYCKLCHRQALPSKTTMGTKKFNPIDEHRPYCPFVDRACGFEEPDPRPIDGRAGWQVHLQILETFIERLHHPSRPSSHDQPLDSQTNCVTLESIAQHFHHHHHQQQPSDPSSLLTSSSILSRPPADDHPSFSSTSPQIKLLNFVKEVLYVSSPSSTRPKP